MAVEILEVQPIVTVKIEYIVVGGDQTRIFVQNLSIKTVHKTKD